MRGISLERRDGWGCLDVSRINDVLAIVRLVLRLYLIKFVMDF